MTKVKTMFRCQECGVSYGKWAGYCAQCGGWNCISEERVSQSANKNARKQGYAAEQSTVQTLADVSVSEAVRRKTGLDELDRVLGGGLVQGSVVLLGGDPGIGKSTLLLQAIGQLSQQLKTLYITGEESLQQVRLRATRLHVEPANISVLAQTCVESIMQTAEQIKPDVIVIDSIQTMYTEGLSSAPGGVGQVRESAAQLVQFAKQTQTALFLVGHVTKEGALAGPRVLEHMVDAVLYFEGDRGDRFRLIRAVKNRFGAANELGVFAMTDKGLRAVTNPSAIFLSRGEQVAPGSAIMASWEGTRPLLVEVQALVDESHLANPRRVTVGVEHNRLAMLLAVLHRHGGIAAFDQDVFVNIVGGVRLSETAADLAILLAVVSSLRNKPLPREWIVFGEVGLSGEIRPVQSGQARILEAAKHGFTRALVPKANAPKKAIDGLSVCAVDSLSEALAQL